MLLLFVLVRMRDDDTFLGAWIVATMLLAVRWPGSGLGIAAALVVFPQPTGVGLNPSVGLIAACAVGFAVDLALHGDQVGPMRRRLAIVVAGVIALAAATLLALMRSLFRLDPDIATDAARRWIEFGAGLALFVMLLRAFSIGSNRPLVVGLTGISVGVGVTLLEILAPSLIPSIGMSWILSGAPSDRATGPFFSPNRLGTVAGIIAIVGACQALLAERWRWLLATLAAVSIVVLLASFSRGALFGLVVAGGAVLALRSRRVATGYLVVVLIVAVVAVPLYVGARLASASVTLDVLLANDLGRFDAWLAGVRMILAEPIFGHGFGAFRQLGESFGATDGLQTAHNEFIAFWAESGIAAIVAYVVTAAGVVACALERRTDSWATAAIGALAVFLVASSFNLQSIYLAVTGPLWLVVAYGIARPLAPPSHVRAAQ